MRITCGAVVLAGVETGGTLGMVFDTIDGKSSGSKVVMSTKVLDPIETCMTQLVMPKKKEFLWRCKILVRRQGERRDRVGLGLGLGEHHYLRWRLRR